MVRVFLSPLGTKYVDSYDVMDGRRLPKAVPFYGSLLSRKGSP